MQLTVEGIALIDPEKQQPLAIASDGIALDSQGGHLYFKALTGHTLYRVKLADLEREGLRDADLAARVENLGAVAASDGLEFRAGGVLITAIEDNAITFFDVAKKTSTVLARDERLKWPDSLACGPEGALYVTSSQIHLTPRFNGGADRVTEPFRVFRLAFRPR